MTYGLRDRLGEFESHVWDHANDPFQLEFDTRRPLTAAEVGVATAVVEAIGAGEDDTKIAVLLRRELTREPQMMHVLLQLAGLTRNKILTDLRASAAKVSIPSSPLRLYASADAWRFAGPYLVSRLRKVLQPLCLIAEPDDLHGGLEALNQATWPGWIRQERAKRSGHEAEGRLANLFAAIGVPFEPVEKAENPLCGDVQISGVSFDLVTPSTTAPRICVKSTVHTANIGQYGESKDLLEVAEAAAMIKSKFHKEPRPIVLALIDGVGFRSNRAGLEGVLATADEFCQFKTIWKAAVIASDVLRQPLTLGLPEAEIPRHREFLDRYDRLLTVRRLDDKFRAEVERTIFVDAGEGLIQLVVG